MKYFAPFEPAQIQALIPLAKDIIARYHIKPENVVAHADIARSAKTIRGHYFLAATGAAGDWCLAGCAAGELLPCRARAAHR